jgi:hypothetical protein
MKLHELLGTPFKKFVFKNGKTEYTEVHVDGDRRRIRVARTDSGRKITRYMPPHSEVVIVK